MEGEKRELYIGRRFKKNRENNTKTITVWSVDNPPSKDVETHKLPRGFGLRLFKKILSDNGVEKGHLPATIKTKVDLNTINMLELLCEANKEYDITKEVWKKVKHMPIDEMIQHLLPKILAENLNSKKKKLKI